MVRIDGLFRPAAAAEKGAVRRGRRAFLSAGKYLHHVHLASRRRVLPGQDERTFVDGFRGLKAIGFHEYCSFECGVDGDRNVEIPKSLAFLREQWEQA